MKNSFDLNLSEEQLDSFANAAVQYNIEKQLRLKYDKILAEDKFGVRKKESFFRLNTILKIAAVAIAVLGSIFLIQKSTLTPTTHTYAQTLLDQTNISGNPNITRKGMTSANRLRREANDAFILKDYTLAITKYSALIAQNEIASLDQFYLGISQLKTSNYNDAIQLFSVLKSENNFESGEVDWLLSLAYVLSDQEVMAVPILKKIISANKYKTKEAKELLDRLN